jgi:hypothetical protein
MDLTTFAIGLGLVVALCHSLLCAVRKRSFEILSAVMIFLAAFSVPGGVMLVRAALSGETGHLPPSWREHVAVAGIVALGLALNYLVKRFVSLGAQQATFSDRSVPAEEAKRQAQTGGR